MSEIENLRPKTRERVMDLVAAAGINVSDWGYASNPKYCYEWAFVEPGKVVVLNLWYELLREEGEVIFEELNHREIARNVPNSVQIKRAKDVDEAVRSAFEESLTVRAVINDGIRRKGNSTDASKVVSRMLDPVVWHVGAYDYVTGKSVLVRGPRSKEYVDQFWAIDGAPAPVATREVTGREFIRDPKVRAAVLARAGGYCELCKEPGLQCHAVRSILRLTTSFRFRNTGQIPGKM